MKKSKVNVAKLQLKKQQILGLSETKNATGGIPPTIRNCPTMRVSVCEDVCAYTLQTCA